MQIFRNITNMKLEIATEPLAKVAREGTAILSIAVATMVTTASVAMIAVNTTETNKSVEITAILIIGGMLFSLGVNRITSGKMKER